MIKTDIKDAFLAYGYSINSDIHLPELPSIDEVNSIDIEIKFEDLSKSWSELSDYDNAYVIQKNLVMFEVPEIAIFSIEGGTTICVSPLDKYDEDVARLYLLGTCMGAILMQRNIFPLHGSAVAINRKAYAFVGNSGAGKSTLASGFLNRGFQLLSDDVIPVSFLQNETVPFVIPSYPQQKLWKESITMLGLKTGEYRPIYGRETKFSIPVSSNYCAEPLPLAGVFELVKSDIAELTIRRIENLQCFYTVYNHTYQNCFIQGMGLMQHHFTTTAKMVGKVNIFQLKRPASGCDSAKMVSAILQTIYEGEGVYE